MWCPRGMGTAIGHEVGVAVRFARSSWPALVARIRHDMIPVLFVGAGIFFWPVEVAEISFGRERRNDG